ncbi:MAG: hypothetical protein ISS63_01420 [Desulfobacteraceae bacterium]|nr:hypothetical protein [Desulfobacteraceae bacterium]
MTRNNQIIFAMVILFALFFLRYSEPSSAQEDGPIIHIEQIRYTFPTVFEGERLSHTFTILNRGTANLEIKKVTHS